MLAEEGGRTKETMREIKSGLSLAKGLLHFYLSFGLSGLIQIFKIASLDKNASLRGLPFFFEGSESPQQLPTIVQSWSSA